MSEFKYKILSPKLAIVFGFHLPKSAGFHSHWCPACESLHDFAVDQPFRQNNARWSFDGNVAFPTFSPSMNIRIGPYPEGCEKEGRYDICHYFLQAGKIQYLGDCTHSMQSKTIDLPDIPQKRFVNMELA